MHLVIDGDQMMYSCGFATEGEPVENALHLVNEKIKSICLKAGFSGQPEIYIKGEGNFRYDIDPEYKATRATRKPEHMEAIRDHLILSWFATPVDGMEADDKVSLLKYQGYRKYGHRDDIGIIAYSPDKDLKCTPGWTLDDKHDAPYWITDEQAKRHFVYQLLEGDRVDNIKGLPSVPDDIKKRYGLRSNKVGKATAKKLMSETKTSEDALALAKFLYAVHYDDIPVGNEELSKNARLLWMTRELDINGRPVSWRSYFTGDMKYVDWFKEYKKEKEDALEAP